jgi:hypothetical protein
LHLENPKNMNPQTEKWNIEELDLFFKSAKLPDPPIKLNPVCVITNVRGYIDFHLDIVNANNGKETFLPYLNRLHQLKDLITNYGKAAI